MKYHSLYRKWRPQTFKDIIGQEHITKTLINALTLDRISHAYIFSGPRGVGKTTTARILAKSLNCIKGPTIYPCNECDRCIKITEGYSMDVIEIDGASNRGIDDVRDLRNKVKFVPTEGNYKVYIIDEVHMLTTEAFNALLKTLEEPPSHVIFVFATTAPHKIPDTILSRCQWFNFRRIPLQKIVDKLQLIANDEKLVVEENALNIIARAATGSMRDAESQLEQIIAYCGEKISSKEVINILGIIDEDVFVDLMNEISKNNTLQAIETIHKVSDSGGDPTQFIRNLTEYVHNLSLVKICNTQAVMMKGIFLNESKKILNQSKDFEIDELSNMVNELNEMEKKMKYSYHPWLLLEMFIIKFTAHVMNKEIIQNKPTLEKNIKKTEIVLKKELETKKEENNISRPEKIKIEEVKRKTSNDINILEVWPSILNKIKKTRISLYSFLAFNNSLCIENDKLMIGFNQKHIFHKEILEKKINRTLLQELIMKETGVLFEIECLINNDEVKNFRATTDVYENSDDLPIEDEIESNINKNKNRTVGKDSDSEEDPILKESLNLFMGKMTED